MRKDDPRFLELVQRLKAMGIPMGAGQDRTSRLQDVRIHQSQSYPVNRMFGLEDGSTALVAKVHLACDHRVEVDRFELWAEWLPTGFELLPDPREEEVSCSDYSFPGKNSPSYPRAMVLNHQTGVWPRGSRLAGLILGHTCNPIPHEFSTGAVELQFEVVDVEQHFYKQKLLVHAERIRDYFQPRKPNPNHKPLFDADWYEEREREEEGEDGSS